MKPHFSEIISDPSFATLGTAASKWAIITHKGVVMTPSVENAILRLDLTKTSGANWQGALRYSPFPVAAGDTFTVSFSVRARHPFTFSVWLGQQDAPYKSLVSEENHFGEEMMTSEWQTFTHTWKPVLSENAARLNFVLGQIDNSIEIKDITLKKQADQGVVID
jgi:hypothetical protein